MKTVVSAGNTTNSTSIVAASATVVKTEPVNEVNTTFSAPTSVAPETVGTAKRPASLDLNKKPRFMATSPLIIDSPDLQNMKALNTPDLEKILLNSNLLQTPQPGVVFPTKVGPVTSEQEAFGKGFEEALHSLHNSNKSQQQQQQQLVNTTTNNNNITNNTTSTAAPAVTVGSVIANTTSTTASNGMSGGSFIYTNIGGDTVLPVSIKDEPQNPSASPPVSPIDMETQEKIKLERKRQRNRVAASKCRKRKLERISKLEDKVKSLKGENVDLGSVVKTLKDHVAQLKQQVIEHIQTGCSIPAIQYNGATTSK